MIKKYKYKVIQSFSIIRNITQRSIQVEVKLGHFFSGRSAIDSLDDDIAFVYFPKNKFYYDYQDRDQDIELSGLTEQLEREKWIEFLSVNNF